MGNANCFKFRCRINNLQKNQEATIFIKARLPIVDHQFLRTNYFYYKIVLIFIYRLWNSTLLQEFPKVDSVQIVSRAKIHIPSDVLLQQNRSDDEFEVSVIISS